MIFRSAKNIYIVGFLWVLVIALTIIVFYGQEQEQLPNIIFKAVTSLIIAALVWILVQTKYVITKAYLFYYSGPFRGKIAIANIRKVQFDKSFVKSTIYKPALDYHGLMIYYNKFDDIFISPRNATAFIGALKKINPDIEIA